METMRMVADFGKMHLKSMVENTHKKMWLKEKLLDVLRTWLIPRSFF